MRPMPYIGITGFTDNSQIKTVMTITLRQLYYPLTMIGVLVSDKTLRGEESKWPKRNPPKEKLASIFEPYANTLNLIHYHTQDQEHLIDQLQSVDRLVGDHCDGYQLNMPWPDPRTLERYLSKCALLRRKRAIVLQCGRRALEKFDHDPKRIAKEVFGNYEGIVDYVLIDPSGGKGQEFDTSFAFECLYELMNAGRNIGPGIAGGLSAKNVWDKLVPIWQDMPERFSIDAEGRLRDENDELDVEKCKTYIQSACRFYPV